ncbi:MAG: methyltransferase domain-containing protein [Candidatus Taylorbacteria bacterium]|nr:methyltransferase domain-containing protein [Candidatus Taylorbacteria bacterium]
MNGNKKGLFARLLDLSMSFMDRERASIVSEAKGVVLEIGFGSGRNVPFYSGVEKIYALEPSDSLYGIAEERIGASEIPVERIASGAESVPLPDSSVDTVLSTWTLCTIPGVASALSEVLRVLKPGGRFLFIEHGKSSSRRVALVQAALNPLWKRCAGGCNLDRDIEALVRGAGFGRVELEKSPRKGRPLAFSYKGTAFKAPVP